MKYINKILSLFVIALIATSCDPDAESYTLGELEDGNQGICFAGNYTQTVEVEPGITSFDLPFYCIIRCWRENSQVDC